MPKRFLILLTLGAVMIVVSCARTKPSNDAFVSFAETYIQRYLELNPEEATQLGDHRYDDRLNDYSSEGFERRLDFNKDALRDLKKINPAGLTVTNRIDYGILKNQIESTIFRIETLKEQQWNPLVYNVGGAIYGLLARDFDTLEARLESVKQRLEGIPRVTAMAKANLQNPPKIHTETAILQNKGTISLVRDQLTEIAATAPPLDEELKPYQDMAIAALEYYGSWLEKDLLPESNGDFRLGEKKFRDKLRYVLDSDLTMADILTRAEADLVQTQESMYETALPLYQDYFPSENHGETSADKKRVIRQVLAKLGENHPNNDTIVGLAGDCLVQCTEFTEQKRLVTVPAEPIDLIVMPEFQRGVAVAYCDSPGPLEPSGKTFYAISPTPADWTEERRQSFFREYNNYMLEDLTFHEAMPGHYLQLAHANRFKAPTMVRAVFSSGTFIEGWATYAEQLMAEQGYGGPQVKMQQQKMRLRMIINAIIDQKIHTQGMTEEQAMDLMINEGFQEEGEASGKWRRACLTSTQLSTYYVGNIEVNGIRAEYERANGNDMSLLEMHDKMLSFGSPPPKYVAEMMEMR